ncbi:MAG: hypothetical protein EON90_12060 [Brevundimonas sp.]|nr:MAG: hypothetical protein EON90_12060 [Brevundimonas sp.]
MLIAGLMMAAALAGHDPDGVVTTARPTAVPSADAVAPVAPSVTGASQQSVAHGLTTDEQIDRWIAARSAEGPAFSEDQAPRDDRKMHGYAEAGIGTGGYRSYGAGVSLPIGEDGRLDLSYRQTENDFGRYGYGYGYPRYGGGLFDDELRRSGGRTRSFGASARWERDSGGDRDED